MGIDYVYNIAYMNSTYEYFFPEQSDYVRTYNEWMNSKCI